MQQYSGHAGGGGLISRHIGWIGGELIKLLQSKFVSNDLLVNACVCVKVQIQKFQTPKQTNRQTSGFFGNNNMCIFGLMWSGLLPTINLCTYFLSLLSSTIHLVPVAREYYEIPSQTIVDFFKCIFSSKAPLTSLVIVSSDSQIDWKVASAPLHRYCVMAEIISGWVWQMIICCLTLLILFSLVFFISLLLHVR